jgi:hypothetical protein
MQIVLTIVVLFAVIRAIRSSSSSPGYITITPSTTPIVIRPEDMRVEMQDPYSAVLITRTTSTVSTQPSTNDVTQGLFLLLRSQDITSERFSCPATQPSKWDFDDVHASKHWSTGP